MSYYLNYLKLRGKHDDIQCFLAKYVSPVCKMDFDLIDPIPEDLLNVCPPIIRPNGVSLGEQRIENDEFTLLTEQEITDLKEKHGASNWLDWTQQHWGVNHYPYEIDLSVEGNALTFRTQESPPFGILSTFAVKHPEIDFEAAYTLITGDNPSCGWIIYRGGDLAAEEKNTDWDDAKIERFHQRLADMDINESNSNTETTEDPGEEDEPTH